MKKFLFPKRNRYIKRSLSRTTNNYHLEKGVSALHPDDRQKEGACMSEEVEKNTKLLKELLNKCDERDCRIVRQLYVILRRYLQKQGRIDLEI